MSVALNSGGNSAADSIVQGAPFEWVIRCETMDAATVNGAWIDTAAGFPGTNSVLGSLSPASSITTRGTSAAYTHSTRTLNIGSSMAASHLVWLKLNPSPVARVWFCLRPQTFLRRMQPTLAFRWRGVTLPSLALHQASRMVQDKSITSRRSSRTRQAMLCSNPKATTSKTCLLVRSWLPFQELHLTVVAQPTTTPQP
jgi:hypothetical protein